MFLQVEETPAPVVEETPAPLVSLKSMLAMLYPGLKTIALLT